MVAWSSEVMIACESRILRLVREAGGRRSFTLCLPSQVADKREELDNPRPEWPILSSYDICTGREGTH